MNVEERKRGEERRGGKGRRRKMNNITAVADVNLPQVKTR